MRVEKYFLVFLLLTITFLQFSFKAKVFALDGQGTQKVGADSAEILGMDNFYDFAHKVSPSAEYLGFIKFILLPDSEGKFTQLVFQNTDKFFFHAEYLKTLPPFAGLSNAAINDLVLKAQGRKAIIGTLLLSAAWDSSQFEIISKDPLAAEEIASIQKRLRDQMQGMGGFSERMSYLPVAELRDGVRTNLAQYEALGVHVAFPQLTDKVSVYSKGWTVGRVKVLTLQQLDEQIKNGLIGRQDLLIVDGVPREIPPVAGLITSLPTAPSSHVTLLASMYNIPFVYDKQAFTSKSWKALEGKFVLYQAGILNAESSLASTRLVKSLTEEQVKTLLALKNSKISSQPRLDLSETAIRRADGLTLADIPKYGGKASQLGLLMQIVPENVTPDTLAIPVSYFSNFLKETLVPGSSQSLAEFVENKLKEIKPETVSRARIVEVLKEIRTTIKKSSIPPVMLAQIEGVTSKYYESEKNHLILRSSSNVEDLEGFNGAGLYSSVVVDGKTQTLESALKEVWSSLYSDRGYLARRDFGIHEDATAMGIAIQPLYEGEAANGVAILKLKRSASDDEKGSFESHITSFPGAEFEVTNPPPNQTPETVRLSQYKVGDKGETAQFEQLARTTLLPMGQTVMSPKEYRDLMALISQVYASWPQTSAKNLELDFEWKLMPQADGSRTVILKQVRPVPQIKNLNFKKGENFIFVPQKSIAVFPHAEEETSDSVLRAQAPQSVKLELGMFTDKDLEKGYLVVPEVKVLFQDKTYEFKNMKAEVISEGWSDTYSGDGAKQRIHILKFKLKNNDIPSLGMSLQIVERRSGDLTKSLSPILTSDDLSASFEANKNDFWREAKSMDARKILWPAQVSSGTFAERTKANLKGVKYENRQQDFNIPEKGVSVSLSSRQIIYDLSQKTTFEIVDQAKIKGLLKDRVIEVSNRKGLIYAPDHHNFSWEYLIDLSLATGFGSEAEKQNFIEKNGRYLVIKYKTQTEAEVSYISKKGQRILGSAPLNPQGGPPGGGFGICRSLLSL